MTSQSSQHHKETREVARGAFINLIGNFGKLSHFAFDLIATRVLGQSLFGYFSTTWLLMHLSFIVCYFGAHRLVIDFVVRYKDTDEDEYYKSILGYIILSLGLSAFLVLNVYLFADHLAAYMGKPPVADYMKIMVWCAPFYCLTTILMTATRGLKIMKLWVFIRNGFEPLVDLILLLVVFFVFGSIAAPFWAKMIAFTLGSGLSIYYFRKHFSMRQIFSHLPDGSTWKRIFSFGFPVMFADFISVVILKVEIIPLSILVPSAQVAVFQVILNTGNTMRNIPQAIDPIMMPVVVAMRQRNDMRALEGIFATLIRSSLFLACGFFVLTTIYGDFLLRIFADEFAYAAGALSIVCFGMMIHTVTSNIEPVLVMSGYPYLNLFNNVFLVAVSMTLDFILIPTYGIFGAAIGNLTGCLLTAALQIAEVHLILKIRPFRRDLLHIVWIGFGCYIIFKGLDFLFPAWTDLLIYDIICVCIFTAFYLYVGWKLFLHDEERILFSSMIHKPQSE